MSAADMGSLAIVVKSMNGAVHRTANVFDRRAFAVQVSRLSTTSHCNSGLGRYSAAMSVGADFFLYSVHEDLCVAFSDLVRIFSLSAMVTTSNIGQFKAFSDAQSPTIRDALYLPAFRLENSSLAAS